MAALAANALHDAPEIAPLAQSPSLTFAHRAKVRPRPKGEVVLHSNIKHVFKDELLPSSYGESLAWPRGPKVSHSMINEEFSLMNMNDLDLTGNYYCLMYYILPDSEKNIFLSKE